MRKLLASLFLLASASASLAAGCAEPPPPVRDIAAETFYIDAASSIADEAIIARNKQSLAELDAGLRRIISMADKGLAGDASNAVCAGHWLAAWARGGAMLGTMSSRQAGYERKWRTAGIAVAYLKAREHVEAADRAVIEQWLDRLADAVEADYGRPKSRNNHYYWAGFAAAAVGTATGSARHLGYASEAFNDGLSAIAADGTLPGEMARKVRALHYNAYALAPLVLMAELAALRGEDWYARHGGAIHRLAAAVRGGVHDPAGFARKAGVPTVEAPTGGVFAWRAFYAARFPARWPDPLEGTLNYPWYGGDCGLAAEVWIKRQGK